MPTSPAPLFFPQAIHSPGLWTELGQTHGLARKDFEWFSHVELASHTLRSQQTPPMLVERILVTTNELSAIPLAGCFVLSSTPDDKDEILYTPYAGIKKYESRTRLIERLNDLLDEAEEDDELLAFMSLSARKTLAAADNIQVSFETIDGDVFEDQRAMIEKNQRISDQALLDELKKLPALNAMLNKAFDELLRPAFAGLDQSQTLVDFYATASSDNIPPDTSPSKRWIKSMSLSDTLLLYYRHQCWPEGQLPEFSHAKKTSAKTDQQHWDNAVKTVANSLIGQLSSQLQRFWDAASADGTSRRKLFSRAIAERARAELLLKREAGIINPTQSRALHILVESTPAVPATLTLETVRLWEYQPNYVELAGSLMISQESNNAYLYTPTQGLLVLKDYQDLKDTLQKKSITAGHDDELYGLMSLEERSRFIGFDQPQISGALISGTLSKTLFEGIISKQLQNIEYALQVSRYSDGTVDIHALFDKALDIRSMIGEQLLTLDTQGRWSTRPTWSDKPPASQVLADTAAAHAKTYRDIESQLNAEFVLQPIDTLATQRVYLENMKSQLAHVFSVGVRAEAELRELGATLRNADWQLVDSVFNPDRPDRKTRQAIKGFRPDAFSLELKCSDQTGALPLANCILLTERGGLDARHSGRAILWTPAGGLEAFATVGHAREQLNLRLLDAQKRLDLLENLLPDQHKFHSRYVLNGLRLIDGNVLQHVAQSAIDHFLGRCEYIRSLKPKLKLNAKQLNNALKTLTQTTLDTNLRRATAIAEAINCQQSLPAWLGLAPIEEQRLHIELLEQYSNNVTDDKDYLHGMQTLHAYARQKLTALLTARFPGKNLDPDMIEITPNLTLAGPAQTLTEYALNHVNIAQVTGFKIASKSTQALPESLNQSAVRQLLLSLNIPQGFGEQLTEAMSGVDGRQRRLRFAQQLPWQLMQHAHALQLQRHLSVSAFDMISQVLDMPDSVARAAVRGAQAIVRPLELIKTPGAVAVKTLGVYLIGPGAGQKGPQVLYAPYHAGSLFTEFESETHLLDAINVPGLLQELVIRRLPENQQSTMRNLFRSTVGQSSDMTLASTPIDGNLLTRLFDDNVSLLSRMLGSQKETSAQQDWDAIKNLFSSGIKLILSLLPGKLSRLLFLWQAFEDFKDSAEALQNQHWKRALRSFIAGAAQMITLGRLSLESELDTAQAVTETAPVKTPVVDPQWSKIKPTTPTRTSLQPFEATTVALKDLTKNQAEGTYDDPVSKLRYAAVAGKIYGVAKPGAAWQISKAAQVGPVLEKTSTGQLVVAADQHTVHYGKAMSKMFNEYLADREVNHAFNIEARGMANIRAYHPNKARMIVQAIDMARYYALNSLHNLAQARSLKSGTRMETLLKSLFDVNSVDISLLDKIGKAVVPICNALVDPNEELMDSERFVVGSLRSAMDNTSAFVVDEDERRHVHFADRFFDPQLDLYKSFLTVPFDVDAHAQASILIHEFSHLFSKTIDIAYVEARRPFSDLISPITGLSAALKHQQEVFQREALSMATPRDELFARWSSKLNAWISLDSIPNAEHVGKEILKTTGCTLMDDARTAFRDRVNPDTRIDVILRNADSIAHLICQMGRQLDPVTP